MEKQAKIYSKGGRLFVVPSEVIFSETGKNIIATLKSSPTYKKIISDKRRRNKEESGNRK